MQEAVSALRLLRTPSRTPPGSVRDADGGGAFSHCASLAVSLPLCLHRCVSPTVPPSLRLSPTVPPSPFSRC
jgi:hypothetical protein